MKFITSIAILLVFVIGKSQGSWTQKANFPSQARYGAVALSMGGKGYVIGGYNGTTNFGDNWEYDPAANSWTQKASMNQGRRTPYAFSVNGKAYVGMGAHTTNSPTLVDFWEYDPSSNAWNQKANFPSSARYGGAGFSIGQLGYVCCGNLGTSSGPFTNELWEYSPATNAWNQKANFAGNARYGVTYSSFVIGTKAYVGLGGTNSTQFTDFYCYDPSSNTWSAKANYPGSGKGYATGFGMCYKGYMGAGQGAGTPYGDFWQYDEASNAWTSVANYGGGSRWIMPSTVISGKAYVGTGYDFTNYYSDWWEYTCAENGVAEYELQMSVAKINPTVLSDVAYLSIDGQVLLENAELILYDPQGKVSRKEKVVSYSHPVLKDGLSAGVYTFSFVNDGKKLGWGKLIVY